MMCIYIYYGCCILSSCEGLVMAASTLDIFEWTYRMPKQTSHKPSFIQAMCKMQTVSEGISTYGGCSWTSQISGNPLLNMNQIPEGKTDTCNSLLCLIWRTALGTQISQIPSPWMRCLWERSVFVKEHSAAEHNACTLHTKVHIPVPCTNSAEKIWSKPFIFFLWEWC